MSYSKFKYKEPVYYFSYRTYKDTGRFEYVLSSGNFVKKLAKEAIVADWAGKEIRVPYSALHKLAFLEEVAVDPARQPTMD